MNHINLESGRAGERHLLRKYYDSFEDFKQWSDIYGLSRRLGYDTAEEAWEENPLIQRSVDPSDWRKVDLGDLLDFIHDVADHALFDEAVDDEGDPLPDLEVDLSQPMPAGVHVFHRSNQEAHNRLDRLIRIARSLKPLFPIETIIDDPHESQRTA